MRVLRIFAPKSALAREWEWALVEPGAEPRRGGGSLLQLSPELLKRAERIQLVAQASSVLITRARLPPSANRRSGVLLAYAVEESTVSEPDANEVNWIGSVDGSDVLAVMDRKLLGSWRDALGSAGIYDYSVACESLLVPWRIGRWSCVWDGQEGFVRTGEFEGAATDCGKPHQPPVSLRLLLESAKTRNDAPTAIDLHAAQDKIPDVAAWQQVLGITVNPAPPWDWRAAPPEAGIDLAPQQRTWRVSPQMYARLGPAAWIAGIALAVHALALAVDWTRLAAEQKSLRTQMESRFRSQFPEALAVADPALQMRRKLAEVRRAANKPDEGDFTVMLAKAAGALKVLPAGVLQTISYESGRMTLEFLADDSSLPARISTQLAQAGLIVSPPVSSGPGKRTTSITLRAP